MSTSSIAEHHKLNTRNPLSLRLYKVLGTSYDDQATRQALITLSDLYATPTERPLHAPSVEDKQTLDPENSNDASPPESSIKPGEAIFRARKSLRSDLENKLTQGSQKFLTALEAVDRKLEVLEGYIVDMHRRCNDAEARLRTTSDACSSLLSRANGLRSERQEVGARQAIISVFLDRFTLNNDELESLTSREIPVTSNVFSALRKCQKIREDCAVLLSGEEEGSQAGMDIMVQSSKYLDQGYQKIYRWCCTESRTFGVDSQLEVSVSLKEGLHLLRQREDLYEDTLGILGETRQHSLLHNFLTALTRGGPNGFPRPIELHAHDPVRYVGDMLAWIHQAIAGEHEFLESLLLLQWKPRMMGSVRDFDNSTLEGTGAEEEKWMASLMDTAVEGLCKPLKLRVAQTVRSQEGSVISYRIANLLQFYTVTMGRTVGVHALLSRTLQELTEVSFNAFFENVEAYGRSLLRFLHPPDADLSTPLALLDSTQILKEMMSVYESSLLGDEDEDKKASGFRKILDACINPLIEMCQRMADLNSSKDAEKDAWAKHIFLANCISYLQTILQSFSFTADRVKLLNNLVKKHEASMVQQHYDRILGESGLRPIVEAIAGNHESPLSHTELASGAEVSRSLALFSDYLSGLDVISSPHLALLSAPGAATTIHRLALRKLGHAYSLVCSEVRSPDNKFEFASTLLGSQRPFGQMNTLWQILGIEEEDIV